MKTPMDAVHSAIAADAIEASALATNMAIVLTNDEIVTGKSGLWRHRIKRFPLCDLVSVREFADPRMSTLALKFVGTGRSLMILYDPQSAAGITTIIARLRQRLNGEAQEGNANG